MITANEITTKLDEALKRFGTYQFEDKGADEIMDMQEIAEKLKTMTSTQAGQVMKQVASSHDRGQQLINDLVMSLDSMDEEWFEDMLNVSGAEY